MTDLLFVYGSLRRGSQHRMARLLDDSAKWMGVSRVAGLLYQIDWYLGLVPVDPPSQWVEGDLYRMRAPETLLPLLDDYEECSAGSVHPQEYRREVANVEQAGAFHRAWIYFYNRPVTGLALLRGSEKEGISRFSPSCSGSTLRTCSI